MSSTTPALLSVTDLVVKFDTPEGVVHAVNGISYELERGGSLGIVGESGSGKSVSVQAIAGLLPSPPARVTGTATFNGQDLLSLTGAEMRSILGDDIGMIFQDPMTSLNPVLTIERQMTEASIVHLGLSKAAARQKALELLKLVEIPNAEGRLKSYPHELSGGQRQRVCIAMALTCDPLLLIADEPTTALDVTIQAQIMDLVRRLQVELDITVIWITHDLGVAYNLVSDIAVMYGGRVVETGSTQEVFDNPRHPYTKGLLASLPGEHHEGADRLHVIEGMPPDLRVWPAGCTFARRCEFSIDKCGAERPNLEEDDGGRSVACWRWEEVAGQTEGVVHG